ncbi:MAG: flagellar biosynthesis protein FlhB [Gammaproteobacteria bacterium]|nr:flagellar biosynthesis protein FlhB [Gammaproteobacteria bacterium]
MADNDNGQERSEPASQKRLQDARRRGQVPRSRELSTATVIAASGLAFVMLGQYTVGGLRRYMGNALSLEDQKLSMLLERPELVVHQSLVEAIFDVLGTITPFLLVTAIAAIASGVVLGGLNFSAESLKPKLERIDPLKGLGRMFGVRSLVELGKSILKVVALSGLAWAIFAGRYEEVLGLGALPIEIALPRVGELLVQLILLLVVGLALIAMVDVPYQLWNHARQLRMTKREVKDENKETEGSPELRQRVRQAQRDMAQRRMMDAVPLADVIVTNPTHYAVALRYEEGRDQAPRVVAKGVDLVAANIRRIAQEHAVPIVEAPPLARALHGSTEIGDRVPQPLYVAVARVLVYVYELKRSRQTPGGGTPELPSDLPIPAEFAARHAPPDS